MPNYRPIKVMPPELASQIAAGEVVERAASVIKELIENSLDAGATELEIDVSIKKSRLRVKDNGNGIAAADITLAVARHGTSKVESLDDIFNISSFGFRGEALPSIGSVSRLTITSHQRGEAAGKQITVEGGKAEPVIDAAAINGTELLVENLFFNTPARRKFTRADSTEMSHLSAKVIQAALSAPAVRFTYTKDGKRAMELPPAKSLRQRVSQIFGRQYDDNMVDVEQQDGGIKITGLAGTPSFSRATAIDQYFFVNGRPVKDPLIRGAVAHAFSDLMPKGRKPVLFLNIKMPPTEVDVNVHPTKAEVRFADPSRVRSSIVRAIRGGLNRGAVATASQNIGSHYQPSGGKSAGSSHNHRQPSFSAPSGSGFSGSAHAATTPQPEGFDRSFELWSNPIRSSAEQFLSKKIALPMQPVHGRLSPEAVAVGQLFNTFILMQDGDRFIIMDQHTVHERILFERFMTRIRERGVERQALLIPETISLGRSRAEVMASQLKLFSDLGWAIESFGETDFIVREVPALLAGKDISKIVSELAETVEGSLDVDFELMMADLVSRMACRASVMAGDRLTKEEMVAMVEELGRAERPYSCPHGRPVAVEITRNQLFNDFGRPL